MKKSILFLVALFAISTSAFSQLSIQKTEKPTVIGSIKPGGVFIAELSYYPTGNNDGNNVYLLQYQPAEYAAIHKTSIITFTGNQETIDALYQIYMSAFEAEDIKSYEQSITLGKTTMLIQGMKMMGIKGVRFAATEYGVTLVQNGLSKSQIQKLFGK